MFYCCVYVLSFLVLPNDCVHLFCIKLFSSYSGCNWLINYFLACFVISVETQTVAVSAQEMKVFHLPAGKVRLVSWTSVPRCLLGAL